MTLIEDLQWRGLLATFPRESPPVRRTLVDSLLANRGRTAWLLDEIEARRIKVGELDRLQVDRLLKSGDATIQRRAQKLLAEAIPATVLIALVTDVAST